MIQRHLTRKIRIADRTIGGGCPILIQSMTNTRTADTAATVSQILELEQAGCELVRCTVPDMESAEALSAIKKQIHIPLIADIHFDYRLAVAAAQYGADKIRINPGNLGGREPLSKVVTACRERQIPIRVGVNSGSLEKDLQQQYGRSARALCESALRNVKYLEDLDFGQIVVSLKSSDVETCIQSYELFAKERDYPLHIGITEAGSKYDGTIKSSIGLGVLLHEGIGDTIRVSLTAQPVEEIRAAQKILEFLGIRRTGPEIISCPTCGRTQIHLIELAARAEQMLSQYHTPMKVAIMGCVVNGPGEAQDADFGIAGGKGEGLVFRKGKIIRKVPEDQLLEALKEEADRFIQER